MHSILLVQDIHAVTPTKPMENISKTSDNFTTSSIITRDSLRGHWHIVANGYVGDLNIVLVDRFGNVFATVSFVGEETNQLIGLWDETSQKISFIRIIVPGDDASNQIYTGYAFCFPVGCPPQSNTLTLAGSFEAFQSGGGTGERSVFGWYAAKNP